MTSRQTAFFATAGDIIRLSADFVPLRLQFVLADAFDSPTLIVETDPLKIQSFKSYLVAADGQEIRVRAVRQRDGQTRFIVDQLENPGTAMLYCGGLTDSERLLSGQIGTARGDAQAQVIYRSLTRALQNHFEKIKSYYVGTEAARLLDSGVRLSPTLKSPPVYDLVR